MDDEQLENLIYGLVHYRPELWTDQLLAHETREPLVKVQAAINRLVAAGLLIQTGQRVRRVIPAKEKP